MSDSTPVQIDYTSRDYESIRQDIIARIQRRLPAWNSNDPADFGVALVEAFAYMGDLLSYYVDRAANEATLTTATRRESVVALAKDMGYNPLGYRSSTVVISILNSSESSVAIPEGTVVSANLDLNDVTISVPFETVSSITIAADSVAEVGAVQGVTISGYDGFGEYLGNSPGDPDQEFTLAEAQVVTESIQIYVYDGINHVPWTRVNDFTEYGPMDRVFSVIDSGNGEVKVRFGDGVSGMIPPTTHLVYARYRTSLGIRGNVPAGSINQIDSIPNLSATDVAVISGSITVTNDLPAYGGSDPESTESIRRLAPLAYRTANRAVTLEDYQNIALGVDGCGKASAFVDSPTSVVVSLGPYRSPGPTEPRPGYDEEADEWVQTEEMIGLKDRVFTKLEEVSLAGVNVAVIPPTYVPVYVALTVEVSEGTRQEDVQTLVAQAIFGRFDYASVPFGGQIYESDLVALVLSLGPLIRNVEVTRLNIVSNTLNTVGTVMAAEDELLLLTSDTVTITVTDGTE